MIITITGKPCSGKGTVSKILCDEHNFDYISGGELNRKIATELGYTNTLELQRSKDVFKVDKLIDEKLVEISKLRANDDLIVDSRLGWHFIPNSFKVFIDVSLDISANRLLKAGRNNETATNLDEAKTLLQDRWTEENNRYMKLYGVNNCKDSQYDFIISSDNLTPKEIADKVWHAYMNNQND